MKSGYISVIIVNWNGKKWLKKCLDSLLNQSYKKIEIVFVDNGSTDGSVEFVTKYYKNVLVVRSKKNLGFASGNNLGIKKANGEYIALLNSDTWLEKDFFKIATQKIKKLDIDVYGVKEFDYKGLDIHGDYTSTVDFLGHTVILDSLIPNKLFYLSGAFVLFRQSLYKETGGLDNDFFMYCEEVDWFWRLHLYRKSIFLDTNNHFNHFGAGSQNGIISESRFRWRNQNALQIILKNYSLISLVFVLPIYFIQNIFEMIAFLVVFKPNISKTYLDGWLFNFKILNKTLRKRESIQKKRNVSDFGVYKKMYIGLGKIRHIIIYLSNK